MVCTGNIGRSPMMERIMRAALEGRGVAAMFDVTSAGTWGQQGHEMEPGALLALTELGLDTSGFAASRLTDDAVARADLVLVATREHRSQVVNIAPSAVRRTFTLHELARIAGSAPPRNATGSTREDGVSAEQVREAVAWAAQVRGAVPRPEVEDVDDLADPLGAPHAVYRERARAIAVSVERIVPYLLGRGQAG
jgi:protein-tyrosine phosphatase